MNGKTVGIVYEVDPDGIHGKAFSLTVYNLNDLYFFAGTPDEWVQAPDGGWVPGKTLEAAYTPIDPNDGRLNAETMKNDPDWETDFQMLKWVEDLAAEQGVEWYIPAINELKDLFEYMSNAQFTNVIQYYYNEDGSLMVDEFGNPITNEIPDAIDEANRDIVEKSWDNIRNLYKTYTADSPDYEEEQYVVFKTAQGYWGDEGIVITDMGDHRNYVESAYDQIGDNNAYRWFSSTLMVGAYDTYIYSIDTEVSTLGYAFPGVCRYIGAVANVSYGQNNYLDYSGSIHPICRF